MIHLTLKYPDIDFLKEEDDRVLVRNKFIQPLYLLSCLDIKLFFFFMVDLGMKMGLEGPEEILLTLKG